MAAARIAHQNLPFGPKAPYQRQLLWNPPNAHHMMNHHPSPHHRHVAAPRVLPILQPPTYVTRSVTAQDERKELKKNEKKDQPKSKVVDNEKNRKPKHKVPIQIQSFNNQQNYPRQPLPHRSARQIRYAEPKYPMDLFSHY